MNDKPLCALTFDDGPSDVTPLVLDKLQKYDVPASFFLVGNNITPENAEYPLRAFRAGCEINNHSRTHSAFPELSVEEMKAEIAFTSEKIIGITGEAPHFFRPPYIAVNETMFDNIDLPFIAGIGAEDWLDEVSAGERARRILSRVSDGDVILLHDAQGNIRTVEALDEIISGLKARGFGLVTVSELFRQKGVIPKRGIVYTNVFQTEVRI